MFYLNVGYRWNQLNVDELRGAIFLPSKFLSARTREISGAAQRQKIVDPQLYLCGLDYTECSKVCANLGSHPWYSTSVPEYDSDETNRREWSESIRTTIAEEWSGYAPEDQDGIRIACHHAISVQDAAGVSEIVLPTPLIGEREDEALTQAIWIDHGLAVAEELQIDKPLLASIFLHEGIINHSAFSPTGILSTIADQIAARNGLAGVYIGIAQTTNRHPFQIPKDVARAYARLSQLFSNAGFAYVLLNFADLFGYVCTGIGATSFATGPSHALRRLSMEGFKDESFGIAFPHLYSHRLAAELTTEGDLDRIVARRALRRVRDTTEYSRTLMAELSRGGSASNLRAWAESRNNLAAAQAHYIARLARLANEQHERALEDRTAVVRDWLEEAAGNQLFIRRRIGEAIAGRFAPAEDWLDVLDEFS